MTDQSMQATDDGRPNAYYAGRHYHETDDGQRMRLMAVCCPGERR